MLYLSTFAEKVIGVEIVEKAILAFFEENNLSYEQPDAETYVSGNITLLCKDFMALTPKEIGPIDWVYDRAALVALPDSMRKEYLTAIDRLTGVGTQSLVITLEYAPAIHSAPFSIPAQEVEDYYSAGHFIKHAESPLLMQHGMVRRWNLEFLYEHGFILTKQRGDIAERTTGTENFSLLLTSFVVKQHKRRRILRRLCCLKVFINYTSQIRTHFFSDSSIPALSLAFGTNSCPM